MKRGLGKALAWGSVAMLVGPGMAALGQTLDTDLVVSGLARPVYVTHVPGDFNRVFIVEQRGSEGVATRGAVRIVSLATDTLLATPFLRVNGVTTGSEQGLLGLAFHPDYATNGWFYVNYTTSGGGVGGQTVVARYTVSADPNTADPNSAQTVLTFSQPDTNHNGGWMSFGPDGYLYIAAGDGGGGGDPDENGQDPNDLLGSILRIDIDGDDFPADPNRNYAIPSDNPFAGATPGADEVWAWGLRNPWRDAFDRRTGDLYIADVGQGAWEEINFQPAGSPGGQNYGWDCWEGNASFESTGCASQATMTFPFLVYGHFQNVPPTNATGCSITGGEVYRGCEIPTLDGTYFFADYCSGNVFSLRYDGAAISDFANRTADLDPPGALTINNVTSFGLDAFGEMYITDLGGGEVYRIVATTPAGPDCNANGRRDACDILAGTSADADGNGVPDECDPPVVICRGDCNCDGAVGFADIDFFVAAIPDNAAGWAALFPGGTPPPGCTFENCDVNDSGSVGFDDIDPFVLLIPSLCP